MKILVAYKRVVDYNVRIQVRPDGSGVVTEGVKLSANPFDDIALEEALRLRDKGVATEVIVVTIGPADCQAHLRNGLAMGANRAIHVVSAEAVQPLTAARVTREVDAGLETLEVDLPAVITTDLRLNEPRFIKLPDIMKAKSKPLESLPIADLGVETGHLLTTTHFAPPAKRSKGVMVKDAAELVAALKAKGLL